MNRTQAIVCAKEFYKELESIYGSRLYGGWLFGSTARGDSSAESDVDVMIALDGAVSLYKELARTGEIASALSIKHGATINRYLVSSEKIKQSPPPVAQFALKEGVRL